MPAADIGGEAHADALRARVVEAEQAAAEEQVGGRAERDRRATGRHALAVLLVEVDAMRVYIARGTEQAIS